VHGRGGHQRWSDLELVDAGSLVPRARERSSEEKRKEPDARHSALSSRAIRRAASLTSAVLPAPLAPVTSTPGIAPPAPEDEPSARAESECTTCAVSAESGRSMPASCGAADAAVEVEVEGVELLGRCDAESSCW